MQRRLCSAILLLESIVLGLSTAVMISVESVDTSRALWTGLGLAVACVVAAGLLGRTLGYHLGWAIQAAAIALGFVVTAMFALGAIFLALWITAVRLGRTIDHDRDARPAPAADSGPEGGPEGWPEGGPEGGPEAGPEAGPGGGSGGA